MNTFLARFLTALVSLLCGLASTGLGANPNSRVQLLPAGPVALDTILGRPLLTTGVPLVLTNSSRGEERWIASVDATWVTLSESDGLLLPHHATMLSLHFGDVTSFSVGRYTAMVVFKKAAGDSPLVTFSVVLSVRLPAPALAAEPKFSRGTTNTLFWTRVPGANEYEVQASTTPDFASSLSSGWLRGTNYTFSNLVDGAAYLYRVHCRSNSFIWSQTLATQFATNENNNVSTRTQPGDLVLEGNTNRIWFEDFEEPGSSWTNTLFNDLRLGTTSIGSIVAGENDPARFEKDPLDSSSLAPDTQPPLPINQGGDQEGSISRAVGFHRYAFATNTAENQLSDATVDAYIGFVNPPGSRYTEGGLVLRADPDVRNGYLGGNGYMALLSAGFSSLDMFVINNGILYNFYVEPRTGIPALVSNEIYHLRFSAIGTDLSASLWRVYAQDEIIHETPVDFGRGSYQRRASSDMYTRGVVGLSGIAWGDNSRVLFDDVTVLADDGPAHYARSGTSIATVEPPNWFDHWGRLAFTGSAPTPETKLTVDVLSETGSLLAANVANGTDLAEIPSVATARGLRLRANLRTTDPTQTPALSDWTVTWHLPGENASESPWGQAVASTQDNTPPVVVVTSPVGNPLIVTNRQITNRQITFTGTAFDPLSGVSRVYISTTNASTTNGYTNWVLTYTLPFPGSNHLRLNVLDGATPPNRTNYAVTVIYEPALHLQYTNGAVFLLWPSELTSYVVQSATNLLCPEWQDVTGEEMNSVVLAPTESQRFFRLVRRPVPGF